MSWLYFHIRCILLLLVAVSIIAKGQQTVEYPPPDKLRVLTDRTLYITGETVHFSAFEIGIDPQKQELSRILYAEIVSPDVHQVTGSKFSIVHHASEGSLVIPKNIISGFYYLRVYTKYMRNLGPGAYSYVSIRIINPLRNDIMTGSDTLWYGKGKNNTEASSEMFIVSVDKKEYNPRDTVDVSIDANSLSIDTIRGMSISVIPELSYFEYPLQLPAIEQPISKLSYYPETRGLSISGELKDISGGKVVPGARVNLSIIGEGRDFMAIQTDSSGRFIFALPAYTGYRDIYLCAESKPDFLMKILVDNDFCTAPFQLPSPVFKLTNHERTLAYHLAVNSRLLKVFDADTLSYKSKTVANSSAFYGTPSDILFIDKYVELPTLEENFNELPNQVKVRKKQGEKYLKVIGAQPEMLFYDPLILMDWVAVDDPAKVLAVSPKNINRIEVINQPYIKGNITYGGIVSIISGKGDFAGIDLPESGIFIHFKFLPNKIKTIKSNPGSQSMPDARNTLYWEPNIELNEGNKTHFTFSTPDTPGRYQVMLKGVSNDGNIFTQTVVFVVKPKN